MDKLNEEISSAVQLQSNNLSLGVSCGLQYFLPQAGLREFSQTHPDISLFIEESDSRKCEALVATGDYTAALTIGAVENPGLVVVNLLQRQRVAIVPKSSPLASRSALHISDLDGQGYSAKVVYNPERNMYRVLQFLLMTAHKLHKLKKNLKRNILTVTTSRRHGYFIEYINNFFLVN